jgi:hypothetical protein
MPTETALTLLAITVPFVLFALVLAWASNQAGDRGHSAH